ncbi:hypothetical protein INT47_000841 [Mucor saturninus]|uniref:Uncharacterized protein n=1 Tax=Mucor saturninus TaxID=64648 RepID=A0A8H7RPG5_9FUNG|nr:hypothetical protein INT47_000841 [Mucor saturninus]
MERDDGLVEEIGLIAVDMVTDEQDDEKYATKTPVQIKARKVTYKSKKNYLALALRRLNRKEDNTEHLRPDATMKHFDRKLFGTTLGYCEVKSPDAQKDIGSLCTDLIRLAILSRKLMLRKANHVACSLQAVGKKFNIVRGFFKAQRTKPRAAAGLLKMINE